MCSAPVHCPQRLFIVLGDRSLIYFQGSCRKNEVPVICTCTLSRMFSSCWLAAHARVSDIMIPGVSDKMTPGVSDRMVPGISDRMILGISDRMILGATDRMIPGVSDRMIPGVQDRNQFVRPTNNQEYIPCWCLRTKYGF